MWQLYPDFTKKSSNNKTHHDWTDSVSKEFIFVEKIHLANRRFGQLSQHQATYATSRKATHQDRTDCRPLTDVVPVDALKELQLLDVVKTFHAKLGVVAKTEIYIYNL